MKVMTILGTRPEIIRLSLIIKRLDEVRIKNIVVYTGQNYHPRLSTIFFKELKIRKPDIYLNVKEKRVGSQIARIIERSEEVLLKEKPDLLLVLGDTNSGLSSIAATRHFIPILHMEAGNRCFDWRVPEEKNRKIIDHISDWLFPYTANSRENLIREGIAPTKIIVSGNPISEILRYYQDSFEKSKILEKLKLKAKNYFLITVHREENVDNPLNLENVLQGIRLVSRKYKKRLIWSVHPRTKKKLEELPSQSREIGEFCLPFGFYDFLKLEKNALGVITDSGTVQEECSLFHVPTATVRNSTERPETVECGSNIVTGTEDPYRILSCVDIMIKSSRNWVSPYEDDFNVSEKIVKFIVNCKLR